MPSKTPVRAVKKKTTAVKKPPKAASPVKIIDRAELVKDISTEVLQKLAAAAKSGRWLLAVWHVVDEKIFLDRVATNFPTVDLDESVKLLDKNLSELKGNA